MARALKVGSLYKRGEQNTAWKRRWFTLNERSLTYSESQSGKASGEILLENIDQVREAEDHEESEPFCSLVICPSSTYSLRADSLADMDEWLR